VQDAASLVFRVTFFVQVYSSNPALEPSVRKSDHADQSSNGEHKKNGRSGEKHW